MRQDPPYATSALGCVPEVAPAAIELLLHPSALLPHAPDLEPSSAPLSAAAEPGAPPAADPSLDMLRAFFPPSPAGCSREDFWTYVSGRRFALCLLVHQRGVDIPDVDIDTGVVVGSSSSSSSAAGGEAAADGPPGRRIPFAERVSSRRATVRIEAIYDVTEAPPPSPSPGPSPH